LVLQIQQGISDKIGAFLQHFVTFLVGYIIAFTKGWDMTLVSLGQGRCTPRRPNVAGVRLVRRPLGEAAAGVLLS
jgi:ATP-binding cassette subfamily B (MDR/TAP) protein 1